MCAELCKLNVLIPGYVGHSGYEVDLPGCGEEVVAEAVDVCYYFWGEGCGLVHFDEEAFGAAADGACYMGLCCGGASAGEDECALGRVLLVDGVNPAFECGDVFVAEAAGWLGGVGGGEVCADVEEFVLDDVYLAAYFVGDLGLCGY